MAFTSVKITELLYIKYLYQNISGLFRLFTVSKSGVYGFVVMAGWEIGFSHISPVINVIKDEDVP